MRSPSYAALFLAGSEALTIDRRVVAVLNIRRRGLTEARTGLAAAAAKERIAAS
jgi:hypothetical protein